MVNCLFKVKTAKPSRNHQEKKYRMKPHSQNLLNYLIDLLNPKESGGDRITNFPETYFDEECTNLHCLKNKARSVTDIFLICHTQNSRITFESVCKCLKTIILEIPTEKRHALIFCPSANKWVVHTWSISDFDFFSSTLDSIVTDINNDRITKKESITSKLSSLVDKLHTFNLPELSNTLRKNYKFGTLVYNYSDSFLKARNKGSADHDLIDILVAMEYSTKYIIETLDLK